jgi:hypothetical protein
VLLADSSVDDLGHPSRGEASQGSAPTAVGPLRAPRDAGSPRSTAVRSPLMPEGRLQVKQYNAIHVSQTFTGVALGD